MRRVVVLVTSVACMILLGACSPDEPADVDAERSTSEIRGAVLLVSDAFTKFDCRYRQDGRSVDYLCEEHPEPGPDGERRERCAPTDDYADIVEGVPVTIRNEEDTIIATSRLGSPWSPTSSGPCIYEWVATDVPAAEFYVVSVEGRGGVTLSRSELEELGWEVETTLGR